jgi:iron complex transport system ATP-binding protein
MEEATDDATPVLELSGASYWRGERVILSGIDWRIRRGEHWALLGANGSGKTTLLKMVGAYDWPCAGNIRVLGRRFGEVDLRELRRTIGIASTALAAYFPDRQPALEIVRTGIRAELGWWRPPEPSGEDEARARQALAAVGMAALAASPYLQLSQGERQRTMIARALVNRPELLILDEPFAGLDPAARESLIDDLGELVRRPEHPTLVLVTHHVEEIPRFVTRALVLKDGRALAQGPVDAVCTSATFAEAFGRPCQVTRDADGRLALRMRPQ